jgi:hypothetical protein
VAAARDAGALARRQVHVDVVLAAVSRAVEPEQRRGVDLERIGRVDLDLEAERTVRDALGLLPRLAEVGAVEGAVAGVAAGAEGGIAADGEHRAAVRGRPGDRADDLTRQVVPDRAPCVAEIGRQPDAAGALGGEQAPARGVVLEAVDPALQVHETEPVHGVVGRAVRDQRPMTVRPPRAFASVDGARHGRTLLERSGECAGVGLAVRRRAHRVELASANLELQDGLGMLERDACTA